MQDYCNMANLAEPFLGYWTWIFLHPIFIAWALLSSGPFSKRHSFISILDPGPHFWASSQMLARSSAFSSPEPTILLACGRNRELWEQQFWNNKGNNQILAIRSHVVCIYGACLKWLLPELSIPAAGQKDRRLWGREWEQRFPDKGSTHALFATNKRIHYIWRCYWIYIIDNTFQNLKTRDKE